MPNGAVLQFPAEVLRPLVQQVVEETIAHLERVKAMLPEGKIAFSEPEAARLLSLATHQLRDERLRGRVSASVGPGRRILYTRDQLLAYLASRKWEAGNGRS